MLVGEVNEAVTVHSENLAWILGAKSWSTCQHHIKDDTKAENVGSVIVGLAFEDFRGNVPRRATLESQSFLCCLTHGGQAIVDNFYLHWCRIWVHRVWYLVFEHDIFWFEVSVHNQFWLLVGHRVEELFHEGTRKDLLKFAKFSNQAKKFASLQIFQHQVNIFGGLVHLVQLNDVRMVDFSQNLNFRQYYVL